MMIWWRVDFGESFFKPVWRVAAILLRDLCYLAILLATLTIVHFLFKSSASVVHEDVLAPIEQLHRYTFITSYAVMSLAFLIDVVIVIAESFREQQGK